MVKGVITFKEAFKEYKDQFVIIGGTACDNVMSNAGLPFRGTKDIDIVIIIEAIKPEFFKVFWDFVEEAGYKNREKSDGKKQFYRFTKPKDDSFPFMLELFSRELDNISMPDESILTPIPTEESIASLSAILLDEDYYDFIISHRKEIEGLPFVTEECLIPLKAKAWMDLTDRKEKGETIKSTDIKKHRNDVARLCQVLSAEGSISLPLSIRADMIEFMKRYKKSGINPTDFNVNMTPDILFQRLEKYYQLA